MSEPEDAPRNWQFYVEDMIGFCERVRDLTAGLDKAAFVASPMSYDATLRNLELIGEAATRIPETVRDAHPEIPWRAIVGKRNRLARAYLHIDDDIIWTLIVDAVPELLAALRKLPETAGKKSADRRRDAGRSPGSSRRSRAACRRGASRRWPSRRCCRKPLRRGRWAACASPRRATRRGDAPSPRPSAAAP